MKAYRRRNYFTSPGYQGRFILMILGIGAAGMAAALTAFNILSYRQIDSVLWKIHIKASSIWDLLVPYLAYTNAVALSLTVIALLMFSRHMIKRTAPPLFRIKHYIDTAAGGNLTADLAWTEQDEFKETADDLNAMVDAMRAKFRDIKPVGEKVVSDAGVLQYLSDNPRVCAGKCSDIIYDLQSLSQSLRKMKETHPQ